VEIDAAGGILKRAVEAEQASEKIVVGADLIGGGAGGRGRLDGGLAHPIGAEEVIIGGRAGGGCGCGGRGGGESGLSLGLLRSLGGSLTLGPSRLIPLGHSQIG